MVNSVVDLRLQLWGAGIPMNTWQSENGSGCVDGFVYDATYGVGACGDWILDPSIAGAWESGRRLANWLLDGDKSVGLPDRSSKEGNGKFVPSRVALGSGIGTIPSSPNSAYEFPPPNEQSNRPRGPPRSRSPRGRNGSKNNGNRRKKSPRPVDEGNGSSNSAKKKGVVYSITL